MRCKIEFVLHLLIRVITISVTISEKHRSIKIPFPSKRQAEIAYDVLRIDAEPKRSAVRKTLELEENILKV